MLNTDAFTAYKNNTVIFVYFGVSTGSFSSSYIEIVLLSLATRNLVNESFIYLNTEGIQPQNSKTATHKEQHWRTPSYTDCQLCQHPCSIAEFCQALYHNSWDLLLSKKKIHILSAAGRLNELEAPKLFFPTFSFPCFCSFVQRALQAALTGISKRYCPGAMPLAGTVCADPRAGHHSLSCQWVIYGETALLSKYFNVLGFKINRLYITRPALSRRLWASRLAS